MEISEEVILLTKSGAVEDKQALVNAINSISIASDSPEYIEFWISGLLNFSSKDARTICFSVLLNWVKNRWDLFPESMLSPLNDIVFDKFYSHHDFSDPSFKFSLSKIQSFILFHNTDMFAHYIEMLPNIDFYSFYLMILNFNGIFEDNVYNQETSQLVITQICEKGFAQQLLEYCFNKYHETIPYTNKCLSLLFKFLPVPLLFNNQTNEIIKSIIIKEFRTGISILVNTLNREMDFMKPSQEEKKQIIELFPLFSYDLKLETMDLETLKDLSIYIKLYFTPVLDFDVSSSYYDISVALLETNNCTIIDNIIIFLFSLVEFNPDILPQVQELCITKISTIISAQTIPDLDLVLQKYMDLLSLLAQFSNESFLEIIKTLFERFDISSDISIWASLLSAVDVLKEYSNLPSDFLEFILLTFNSLLSEDPPFNLPYIIFLGRYSSILQQSFESYGDDFIINVFIQCSKVALSIYLPDEESDQKEYIDAIAMDKINEQISFIANKYYDILFQSEDVIVCISQFILTKKKILINSMCKIINKSDDSVKQTVFSDILQIFINDESFNIDIENTLNTIKEMDLTNCDDLKEVLVQYFSSIQDHIFNSEAITGEEQPNDISECPSSDITNLYVAALFNSLGIDSFQIISPHLNHIEDESSLTILIKNAYKYINQLVKAEPDFTLQLLAFVMEKTNIYASSQVLADEMPDEEEVINHLLVTSIKLLVASVPLLKNDEFSIQVLGYVINAMNSLRIKEKSLFVRCVNFISSLISQETLEIIEKIEKLFTRIMSSAITSSHLNSTNKMQILECCNIIRRIHQADPDEALRFTSMIMEKIGATQELLESFNEFLFSNETNPSSFLSMLIDHQQSPIDE